MTRLGMLPSESNPLLLFLGVDSGGDNAVFLVDSTLSASGEGSGPVREPRGSAVSGRSRPSSAARFDPG